MELIVMICFRLLSNSMKSLSQSELLISIFQMKQKSIVGWKNQLRKTANQVRIIEIRIKEDREHIKIFSFFEDFVNQKVYYYLLKLVDAFMSNETLKAHFIIQSSMDYMR